MAEFTATPEQLKAAAKEMDSKNADLQATLQQFITGAEGISHSWAGEAQRAFHIMSGRFHDDMTKLNNALLQMSHTMTETAADYSRQEADNQQSISHITNRLNG